MTVVWRPMSRHETEIDIMTMTPGTGFGMASSLHGVVGATQAAEQTLSREGVSAWRPAPVGDAPDHAEMADFRRRNAKRSRHSN